MIKKVLLDKILVYRNVLNNPESILNEILNSKNNNKKDNYISNWEDWAYSGSRAKLNFFDSGTKLTNEYAVNQYKSIQEIKKAFHVVAKDYLNIYKDINYFDRIKQYEFDKSTSLNEGKLVILDEVSILHHGKTPDEKDFGMNYHTDHHQYDPDSRGMHLFITITFYLNDNYEGGELSFIDEKNNSLIFYKPKPGDILVFPSFYPYFHGVDRVLSGDRYLIRTFLGYYYNGSEEWKNNFNEYKNEWLNIEKERIEKEWNRPEYFRAVSYLDTDKISNDGKEIKIPLFKEEAKKKFLIEWND